MPAGAAAWARRLLWADSALSGLAALLALARNFDPYRAGNVELALALGQLGAWLAGFVLALRWLYLANANARALGATDLMGWPGLAVGWFFIPLANLFMPYMTLRDMWRASANPRDWQAAGAPAAILIWWVCWLAAGITATIAFRLQIEFPLRSRRGDGDFLLHLQLRLDPRGLALRLADRPNPGACRNAPG